MHTVPAQAAADLNQNQEDGEEERQYRRQSPLLDSRLNVSLGKRSTAREVILMAATVLVAKFRFGLDGEER
jgi:hypothetical protein